MIHDVLRPQYPGINYKRVYRLYTAPLCQTSCRSIMIAEDPQRSASYAQNLSSH